MCLYASVAYMGQLTHSEGIEHETRIQRSQNGNCPICGDSYSDSRRVKNTDVDSEWPMLGLAYVHDDDTECIEWANGITEKYDVTNDKIIQ